MRIVEYNADGPSVFLQKVGADEKRYRADELRYFQSFSPRYDYGHGVAPGEVGQKSAELIAQANGWATKFFENGAIPAVFLTTDSPVPPEEQKEIESRWDRMLRGVKNAFKTKVLQRGITPTVIGQPVSDMSMPDLERTKREQILAAHKIPPGLAEAKTNRAERDALQFELWTQAIKPEVQVHIKPVVNAQLLNPMGLRIAWDWSQVEAIQRAEIEKAESMSFILDKMLAAYDANTVSVDETRAVIDELLSWLALPQLEASFTPEERMPAIPFGGAQQPPGSEQSGEPPESAPAKMLTDTDVFTDLARWERKALTRFGEGRPDKALEFESDTIPAAVHSLIQFGLEHALSADDVRAVFAGSKGQYKAARFIPDGADDPLLPIPDEVTFTDAEIDAAIATWDRLMPEYRGMLGAEVVNRTEYDNAQQQ